MKIANRLQALKPFTEFMKTTFLGGLIVVIPIYISILLINQIIEVIIVLIPKILSPIIFLLNIPEPNVATFTALFILVVTCFLAGIIVKSSYYVFLKNTLNPLLEKIPGYLLIRRITKQIINTEETENLEICLVAIGETEPALAPAFVIEKHSNSYCTVFIPIAPSPTVGNLFIIPEKRILPISVPFLDMIKFISQWGEASPQLLEEIQKLESIKLDT